MSDAMHKGERYPDDHPVWQRRIASKRKGQSFSSRFRGPRGPEKFDRKQKLLEEQGYTCAWCWKSITMETATIDHVIPVSRGGTNTIRNQVAACRPCNHGRGAS
jgi:5-methylcytosine-specific restriction endonuclease McrA